MDLDYTPPPPANFVDATSQDEEVDKRDIMFASIKGHLKNIAQFPERVEEYLIERKLVEKVSTLRLDELEWNQLRYIITKNCTATVFNGFKRAVKELENSPDGARLVLGASRDVRYHIENGVIYYKKNFTDIEDPVCDFEARIVAECVYESGQRTYFIEGSSLREGEFEVEIDAEDFENDNKLRQIMGRVTGAQTVIHHRMHTHIAPAIRSLTNNPSKTTVYERTGWDGNGTFLIPGRLPEGVELRLRGTANFNFPRNQTWDKPGMRETLEKLITCIGAEYTLPALCSLLFPQIKKWTMFDNHTCFISGVTGSFKSTWCHAANRLFRTDYDKKADYIKWTDTINNIIAEASYAEDLFIFVDNYRPNDYPGVDGLSTLIHAVNEGSTKGRLNAHSKIVEKRRINCNMLINGEDGPQNMPSTLARCILIQFPKIKAKNSRDDMDFVRKNASAISQVGLLWLRWLEDKDNEEVIEEVIELTEGLNIHWGNYFRELVNNPNANEDRVGENLAAVEFTYHVLCRHPDFGHVFKKFKKEFYNGLEMIAQSMAEMSSYADEGEAFLEGIKSLLVSGRAVTVKEGLNFALLDERDKMKAIGWDMDDGTVVIIPSIAKDLIQRYMGRNVFNAMSQQSINQKLMNAGFIQSYDGKPTKLMRIGRIQQRMLVFKKGVIKS